MAEMLDDLFRGIRRDIGAEVSRYMYNSLMDHTRVDFNEVDRYFLHDRQTMRCEQQIVG